MARHSDLRGKLEVENWERAEVQYYKNNLYEYISVYSYAVYFTVICLGIYFYVG